MSELLKPDWGLMVWTAVTFVLLAVVLARVAWRPILEGLERREHRIRDDLDRAARAQKDAEALRQSFEEQLAQAQQRAQEMLGEARLAGAEARDKALSAAKEEADRFLEKGRGELALETERLKDTLRREVADLSVGIAEKLLRRSVDQTVQDEVLAEALQSMKGDGR